MAEPKYSIDYVKQSNPIYYHQYRTIVTVLDNHNFFVVRQVNFMGTIVKEKWSSICPRNCECRNDKSNVQRFVIESIVGRTPDTVVLEIYDVI